jgi:hypothetical protein
MKKFILISAIMILIITIAGCGGSTKSSHQSGYYYKWSTSASASAYAKPFSIFDSVVYAEGETPGLIGSAVPPYGCIKDGIPWGCPALYTYYNDALVESNYTYDITAGTVTKTGVNDCTTIFAPTKAGIIHLTASYNGGTLDIPIRIYYYFSIDLYQQKDFDGDGIADMDYIVGGINTTGYQILDEEYLSNISSAPINGYSTTELHYFESSRIYIIKTSGEKKYAKLLLSYEGSGGYGFYYLISDINGNFEY